MIYYGNNIAEFVLNLLTVILNIFACLISIIVLICIIYHLYSTRIKRQDRIILILSANIYSYIFIFDIIQLQFSISSLLGDLYEKTFDSRWCRFNGYFIAILICALYYGFVVQGIFRLCRVVYSTYRWLQFYWLYVIMFPIQLLVAFIVICPLLVWNDVVYLPSEYYCFVLLINVRGMLWLIFNIYGIPLLFLLFIYVRIIRFIRQQSNNQSLLVKRNQERDLLAIRRIFITNTLLIVFILPTLVLVIIAFITGVDRSVDHRIKMLSYGVSMAVLSIETVFVTPQLKSIMLRIWQRNIVRPIAVNLADQVQVRPIATIG